MEQKNASPLGNAQSHIQRCINSCTTLIYFQGSFERELWWLPSAPLESFQTASRRPSCTGAWRTIISSDFIMAITSSSEFIMVIIASINFIMVIITSSSELIMVIITSRFTITCTRAWRRRRGWAPSSRTGRRSQSESTGSAPCQVRSRKQQISSRYFLTFVSECFRRDSTLLRMSKPWWGEGRHLQCSSNVGWARGGRPGLSLGEMTLIWNFKMKNINKILPQTISRPPTLLRYHFEGTLYPSVLANGNT